MFVTKQLVRLLSSSPAVWNVSKSDLAKLRKKTGYTFANCKKALERHSNDTEKAEKWLHEQAQALGWTKATKVGGRKATEGLVAVVVNKNHGAIVELNCETDFVARNTNFQTLLQTIAKSCINEVPQVCSLGNPLSKEFLDGNKLSALLAPDGKTLADHVALQVGLLGENMVMKRAVLLSSNDNIKLTGQTHPAPQNPDQALVGKYGTIIAVRSKDTIPISEEGLTLSKQLCQHIIGMNPKSVGDPNQDKPQTNADDESVLIYQDFILDPESKVQEILDEGKVEVIDFIRFECGETDADAEESSAARAQA